MDDTIRLRLTIAYVGTEFCGWQTQDNVRTVQQVLEGALEKICQRKIRVHSAGRTDSGVHALAQVCHVDVPASRANLPWRKALNGMLPDDVCVADARVVGLDFHARHSASSKVYAYTLWTEFDYVLPQRRGYVWQVANADFAAMDAAAAALSGTHDFTSFQNAGTPIKNTVRTVYRIWREPGCGPQEQVYRFHGDGFLKQMVRNLVGCMVQVGRGKLEVADIGGILAAKDRGAAPATAPAKGLTLEEVFYGGPPPTTPPLS